MQPKEQLLSLKPYKPGKPVEEVKRELGLEKIVKLASNENAYGCSKLAKEKITEELSNLQVYPDGYAAEIREKLSGYLGVKQEQLIFGNGSDEIIQIICRALLKPGKNNVMASKTFPQYKHNAVIEGAESREVDLINGQHDLNGMLEAIDENTQVVWLCSPNNPTGTYISRDVLLPFLERVPKHVLVVMDEAYYEYVDAEDYPETVQLLDEYENLMILRTFSKAYGLAGLRIGFGMGAESFIKQIEPAREPFNTNRLSQFAAIAALDDQQFIEECVSKNKQGLQQYYQFCEEHQLSYYPSQGNFILIDFEQEGNEVFQYLLERGFIVRSGNALGFPTSVRITVGTQQQNQEIINILTEMLVAKKANV